MTKALWKNFTYVFERFWKRLTEIARSLGFLYVGADNASLGENCQKQLIFCLIKSAKSKLCTYGMTKNSENEIEINWSWSSWPAVLILQLRRECKSFLRNIENMHGLWIEEVYVNFYKNWHTRITPDLPNLSHTCSNNYPFPFQQLLYELWTKSLKNSILALFLKNDSSSTMPAFYRNDSIQNLLQLGVCSRIIKIAKWSWRVRIYLDRISTPGK